jgi:hypothetical protein
MDGANHPTRATRSAASAAQGKARPGARASEASPLFVWRAERWQGGAMALAGWRRGWAQKLRPHGLARYPTTIGHFRTNTDQTLNTEEHC